MKNLRLYSFILTLFFAAAGSCNNNRIINKSVQLARVGTDYLTLNQARRAIPPFMLQEDSVNALYSFRDKWVRKHLILQEANRLSIRHNKDVQERLKRAESEVLSDALKDYVVGKYAQNLNVTDEQAHNYYQTHKDQFLLNERFVRFRHLESADLESARAAKRAIMHGNPWPEVAKKYSLKPNVNIQESKQYWPISMASADLGIMHKYIQVIGPNEISPIQRIDGSYHFIQLMDSRAKGQHPDLEWLIDQIKQWLLLDKKRRHFSSYVKNLYLTAESNNEIDLYNVLSTNSNTHKRIQDTLDTDSIDSKETNE